MAVKIKDLLALKLFKEARILAGVRGLDNVINRVSFSDGPIADDVLNYSNIICKGDLFINGLYTLIGDEPGLLKLFKILNQANAAGMFIVDEHLDTLPDLVLDYAEKHNFPIIFIDKNIPYGQIIETTMEIILMDRLQTISELNIDNLLKDNISEEEIIYYAKRLGGSFNKNYVAAYFSIQTTSSVDKINMIQELQNRIDSKLIQYKGNFLLIINFEKPIELENYIAYLKSFIKKIDPDYKIGVSNVFKGLNDFNICITQSITSLKMSAILGMQVVYYKELNLYKFLYPLKNSIHIQEFYNDVFLPIQNFDKSQNLDLINTIECFILNDGDYKKTATSLHLHHNTIRYRINKAREILNLEDNLFQFIEEFSIALKIHRIIDI